MKMRGIAVVLMPQNVWRQRCASVCTDLVISILAQLHGNAGRPGKGNVHLLAVAVFGMATSHPLAFVVHVRLQPFAFNIKHPTPFEASVVDADLTPTKSGKRAYYLGVAGQVGFVGSVEVLLASECRRAKVGDFQRSFSIRASRYTRLNASARAATRSTVTGCGSVFAEAPV